jgi:K+-transporting ATPase c subunit
MQVSSWEVTIATTVLLGILYPLLVTGLAQLIFPKQANGQLIHGKDGTVVDSRPIGQPFSGPGYFHSRHPPRALRAMMPPPPAAQISVRPTRN